MLDAWKIVGWIILVVLVVDIKVELLFFIYEGGVEVNTRF